ncbi:EamA family transporter [Agrococcus carbonis]|uniref:Inner membrane transporter RhtA n=1 Tax=Agrococcus carbonis TaxID=684552 RepID=A0A1H1Q9R8_9MICO|nr:EamA family transporter [Agrococcus carbonis]SDS20053.1 inner membrane transporter RhtA [Agrococcus carbonis]
MPRIRRLSPGGAVAGLLLVLCSIASVQLGASIAKTVFDRIDPAALTLLRLTFAAVVLLAIARPRIRSWDGAAWRSIVALGIALAGMNLLFYLALPRIPIAVAVTLELVGPLVLALVQSRRLVDVAWVGLAAIGVGVLGAQSIGGDLDPLGVVLALAAGGCWAAYILASAAVGRNVPGVGGLAGALVIATVAVLPFGLLGAIDAVAADASVLLPAFAIAMLSSAIAYGLELLALRRVPTRVFGILMALEPAAAAIFGFLVVGELLSGWDLLALALVVAASAGVAVTAARARPMPPETGQVPLIP